MNSKSRSGLGVTTVLLRWRLSKYSGNVRFVDLGVGLSGCAGAMLAVLLVLAISNGSTIILHRLGPVRCLCVSPVASRILCEVT